MDRRHFRSDFSGTLRAPHIHFDVLGRSNRPVTQMYFAGEPLNDTDRIIQTAPTTRHRLIVPFERPASPAAQDALAGELGHSARPGVSTHGR